MTRINGIIQINSSQYFTTSSWSTIRYYDAMTTTPHMSRIVMADCVNGEVNVLQWLNQMDGNTSDIEFLFHLPVHI